MRQPSSGFTFQKYIKGNHTAVAIQPTVKTYIWDLACTWNICKCYDTH